MATYSDYNERDTIVESLTPCDKTSYMYFSFALLLFTLGALITFFSINEPNFNVFERIWYFGPLLITSGLMVAVKTLIYLKRKTLIALITRQRIIAESNRNQNVCEQHFSNISPEESVTNGCVPPSYEDSIMQTLTTQENSPPSYEEALLICSSQSKCEKLEKNEAAL
ncbi:hypothetical protein B4U79_08486 [Dinothrombium tinctorium]|uniref:Uncharacterized protein n=1 Tax=Dinothrombium tinctorium TaxID=1965070 RepID=A0A443QH60_9ACAR|nr:hypothetical protein B4U79_08486 [Dinothrombium tinctorium]